MTRRDFCTLGNLIQTLIVYLVAMIVVLYERFWWFRRLRRIWGFRRLRMCLGNDCSLAKTLCNYLSVSENDFFFTIIVSFDHWLPLSNSILSLDSKVEFDCLYNANTHQKSDGYYLRVCPKLSCHYFENSKIEGLTGFRWLLLKVWRPESCRPVEPPNRYRLMTRTIETFEKEVKKKFLFFEIKFDNFVV